MVWQMEVLRAINRTKWRRKMIETALPVDEVYDQATIEMMIGNVIGD